MIDGGPSLTLPAREEVGPSLTSGS